MWKRGLRKSVSLVLIGAFALFLPFSALAVAPEIPANGVDDPERTGGTPNGTAGACPGGYIDALVGGGCDLEAPGCDIDGDGFCDDGTLGEAGTTDLDCDPENKWIYTNVITAEGCPGGQTRRCQANGTYTSCTATTVCEATGSGVCRYIHCGTGNDTTGNGTFATPWQTVGMFSGSSAGSEPAGAHTLGPGDVGYILGGTCSQVFAHGGLGFSINGDFTQDGTTLNPIKIKRYPGSTATISNANGPGLVAAGDNYIFEDIDLSTQRTSVSNAMGIWATGTNILLVRSYLHDMAMHGDNNDSCFYCTHNSGCQSERNIYEDCKRSTGNVQNIGAIKWLDDDDVAGQCQNHHSKWDTIYWTTIDATNNGDCWREKHGCDAQDVGVNGHIIAYGSCIQAGRAFDWNSSGMRAHDLIIYGDIMQGLGITFGGESNPQEDNQIEFITMVDSHGFHWFPSYMEVTESTTIHDSIFIDDRASYVAGNSEGIYGINGYGTDPQKAQFESEGYLTSNDNCFYNPLTALVFSYFSQNSAGGGPAGDNYTFAQWLSIVGQDLASFNENPNLNAQLVPQSANCSTFGRRWTAVSGPSPGSGIGFGNRHSKSGLGGF